MRAATAAHIPLPWHHAMHRTCPPQQQYQPCCCACTPAGMPTCTALLLTVLRRLPKAFTVRLGLQPGRSLLQVHSMQGRARKKHAAATPHTIAVCLCKAMPWPGAQCSWAWPLQQRGSQAGLPWPPLHTHDKYVSMCTPASWHGSPAMKTACCQCCCICGTCRGAHRTLPATMHACALDHLSTASSCHSSAAR